MIFALEIWRLIFQVGFSGNLSTWMIQTNQSDYQPLVSLQIVTSYFPEDQEKVSFLQFVFGPLFFSIGWASYCHMIVETYKKDDG